MNYKNIALVLLLLPAANYSNANKMGTRELEEAQTKKTIEVVEAYDLVVKRYLAYSAKKKVVLKFWQLKEEELFSEFLKKFSESFYSGESVDLLIEESPLDKEGDMEDLKFSLIGLVAEKFLYNQAGRQYGKIVEELTTINIKLNELKG